MRRGNLFVNVRGIGQGLLKPERAGEQQTADVTSPRTPIIKLLPGHCCPALCLQFFQLLSGRPGG